MIESFSRQARSTNLKPYCHHSKDHDYMEITEWNNGEGFDFNISDKKFFSLTYGQWECLQVLVNYKELLHIKEQT